MWKTEQNFKFWTNEETYWVQMVPKRSHSPHPILRTPTRTKRQALLECMKNLIFAMKIIEQPIFQYGKLGMAHDSSFALTALACHHQLDKPWNFQRPTTIFSRGMPCVNEALFSLYVFFTKICVWTRLFRNLRIFAILWLRGNLAERNRGMRQTHRSADNRSFPLRFVITCFWHQEK